ncbi:uncharacterized protein KY384_002384 [Bacidia gigantensis]|uniref:uncharacterized protein n=1 Tax=Bacidia gigantensis TaxID=2732470 RepID=UPI001D04874B|nr:uncharacterized protein KY384_002384 [Bacidia gigantensis]KAG8532507.1 hypothetical protein KY384_002384 [Bacidia gigantensis]
MFPSGLDSLIGERIMSMGDGQLQIPFAVPMEPTVTIDSGPLIGTTTLLPSSTVTVNKFLGIPFAISPPERFSPPVPVQEWEAPKKAQAFTSACMQQFQSEFIRMFYQGTGYPGDSEDCLYLNVYAPTQGAEGKSVLFWIYGGNLQVGTAMQDLYDGSSFAANQDVVVVSANYRTNLFGFPNSPDIPLSQQNVGFFDQRLALDWVQRNIAAFGGDPDKVIIVGESSGAGSVDRLVHLPPKPLPFRGAIAQSGQASVSYGGANGNVTAWKVLAEAFGCSAPDKQLACLREVDSLAIQKLLDDPDGPRFHPVNDNITQLATPVDRSLHQSVPYMIGSNGQEGRVDVVEDADRTDMPTILRGFARNVSGLEEAYSIPSAGITTAADAAAQIFTESMFQCPAAVVANESEAAGWPTWRYYYNASFPNLAIQDALASVGQPDFDLRAFHSAEIWLVFGTYAMTNATDAEIRLSKAMQTAWANFAKDPHITGPGWPKYGTNNESVGQERIARLGLGPEYNVTMIGENQIDFRCSLFKEMYKTEEAPPF